MEAIDLLRDSPVAFAAVAGVLGLLVGSFLNVVIYRLPRIMEAEWRRECTALEGDRRETPAQRTYNLVTPRSA